MKTNVEKHTVKLVLEGELTIYTAQETKTRLIDGLAQGDALDADLSGICECDSAGLQVLLLARTEALRAQKGLCFSARSNAVDEVLALCRLDGVFDSLCSGSAS